MDPIPRSEYNYANKIARITLQALEEVMGKNGINAILNLAHLPHLVNNLPPDNLDREFNFADFSALNLLTFFWNFSGGKRDVAQN